MRRFFSDIGHGLQKVAEVAIKYPAASVVLLMLSALELGKAADPEGLEMFGCMQLILLKMYCGMGHQASCVNLRTVEAGMSQQERAACLDWAGRQPVQGLGT